MLVVIVVAMESSGDGVNGERGVTVVPLYSGCYRYHESPQPPSSSSSPYRCGCDECLVSTEEDSLRHSLSRINAYKALASPSLIALSSKDPIRTAFELSGELRRLQGMEHEFKTEYIVSSFCLYYCLDYFCVFFGLLIMWLPFCVSMTLRQHISVPLSLRFFFHFLWFPRL